MCTRWLRTLARTFTLASLLASCGDDGPAQSSGLPTDKKLNTLTDAERQKLCDWNADLFGGYGKSRMCSMREGWPGPASQMICVGNLQRAGMSCAATVQTYEECQRAFFVDEACVQGAVFPPSCQVLVMCFSGS